MGPLPLALSIGILAGIWTYVSGITGLLTWPAFVGWALFFAAGGDKNAIVKTGAPIICGVILGYLSVVAAPYLGSALGLAIAVTIIAIIMVMLSPVSIFTFVPAQFAAAASFFGAGAQFVPAIVPLLLGVLFGYLSAVLPGIFAGEKKKGVAA
ncbi:hypothetical protein SY88_08630 [Clostridiales bacterium PH28_bin88]|nr:hypothetical protein SY88_08630 [Clostridiales bacterium PH28_bin88]